MPTDDYMADVLKWMRDNPEKLAERVRRSDAVLGPALECRETAAGWIARKGAHVGTGPTRDAAVSDLYKKLALVLGGPFGPLGDAPPPAL